MRKAVISCCVLVVLLAVVVSTASALSAETSSDLGCTVEDANGVLYDDPACETHLVVKRDEAGNVVFVQYQDHGHLPAGAAFPPKAVHSTSFFDCGGCFVQGTYEEVITPSGDYKSKGPS